MSDDVCMSDDDADEGAQYVRDLVDQLAKSARVLDCADRRAVEIIADWLEDALRNKVKENVAAYKHAPRLGMYSSDGWSSRVTSRTVEEVGPHIRVDHSGRIRLEFALGRCVVRQLRPSGKVALNILARKPRGMCAGRRHGNFFQAAVELGQTLREFGAEGVSIQVFLLDGLHFQAFMRLMRGRFGFRWGDADSFESELERTLCWCQEWVLGIKCCSHACSNAVVWSLKGVSSKEVQDACHIAIKALRNSSEDLRKKIDEFLRARTRGAGRGHCRGDVECWWQFCLIRADLLPLFLAADPEWDGTSLLVEASFLERPGALGMLATMLLYILQWNDWSETRWCGVKYAARKLVRSEICGVAHIVTLIQNDRDVNPSYCNGYERLDAPAR